MNFYDLNPQYVEIRAGVAQVCRGFPGEYWRQCDAAKKYPEEFVSALMKEGYLAATNELMLMNIDYNSRRSAPWPDFAMERIEKLAAAHAALPRPVQAGRLIGIKKK